MKRYLGNYFTKGCALVMTVAVAAGALTGCGKTEIQEKAETGSVTSEAAEPSTDEELITLTVRITAPDPIPGIQDNRVMKAVEDKFGVLVDYSHSDDSINATSLAAGDLPDIIQVYSTEIDTYIEGGHVIALDDLVSQYGQDIIKNASDSLEFSKNYITPEKFKGTLYGLIGGNYLVKDDVAPQSNYVYGPMVPWNFYAEAGYPEFKTTEEYLDVLEEIQTAHPKTEDGKSVYAFCGWNDWGIWPFIVPYCFSRGYMNGDFYIFDAEGNLQPMFGEEAVLCKESFKMYNQAYQRGIYDPESFTMKYTDYETKRKNNQVLAPQAGGDGYFLIPGSAPVVWEGYGSILAGSCDRVLMISKNCKYPEKAMELINYLYTLEGANLFYDGIEGIDWAMEDGKRELTSETIQERLNNPNYPLETGVGIYHSLVGLSPNTKHEDGNYIDLMTSEKAMKERVTEVDKGFCDHYQVSYPGEAFQKAAEEGKCNIQFFNTTWQALMPDMPDDIKLIKGKIENYSLDFVAKLILSETDEEFEKNWETGNKELEEMGFTEFYRWNQEANQKALEALKSLK